MVRIAVVTFNCGKQLPPLSDLSALIGTAIGDQTPQIVVIALQECVPVMYGALGWVPEEEVRAAMERVVSPDFHFVGSTWCGAVGLVCYASVPTSEVVPESVAVGAYWTSLKGAACLRFRASDEPLTFISAHLAAGEELRRDTERRNADWAVIARGLGLDGDMETVIVSGDLNYRANAGTDELDREVAARRTLRGFREAPRRFGPTYKLLKDSGEYSPKRRASWCDRVFVSKQSNARIYAYSSVDVLLSDHRPVYCRLDVGVPSEGPRDDAIFEGSEAETEFETDGVPDTVVSGDAHPRVTRAVDSVLGVSLYATTTPQGIVATVVMLLILHWLL